MSRTGVLLAIGCCTAIACQTAQTPASVDGYASQAERGDLPALCRRPGDDGVRDVFCAAASPKIRSLRDLQAQLGLALDEGDFPALSDPPTVPFYFDEFPDRGLLLLNTSTALSGRFVSTLNPRALVLGHLATLAFNRGVQQVELISRDRQDMQLNFYLIKFTQACNLAPQGCSPGDLFTPRIESDWLQLTLEDDEELKNTASDCRQCHQRGISAPIFLMREVDGPWPHFFMPEGEPTPTPEPNGVDVLLAYRAAKGDEPYAGIPWAGIRATMGSTLQNAIDMPQPLVLDGLTISLERWPWTEGVGYMDKPLTSPTWSRAYEAFKRGEHLALPHYEIFPSDPAKLAELTRIYRTFLAGELAAEDVPDLSAVYPDDPRLLAEIGFQTEPGATPAQTLVQACGSCHNDVLDQSISRARFNVDLARMDRTALDRAIERIQLPVDDPRRMPPREFRQIDAAGLQPLIEYLVRGTRSAEDDAFLRQAAEWGMALPFQEPRARGPGGSLVGPYAR